MSGAPRPGRPVAGRAAVVLVMALVAFAIGAGGAWTGSAAAKVPAPVSSTVSVDVNISATSSYSFTPGTFTAAPGATVHLDVTQLADFNHTFTLSSVANFTIPSTDTAAELASFFNAHPPLVNLSLGSTVGSQHLATFTAPAALGTYEFVCLFHFPMMFGAMTDSNATSSSVAGGPSTLELVGVGAGVALVLIVAVALLVRRRQRPH